MLKRKIAVLNGALLFPTRGNVAWSHRFLVMNDWLAMGCMYGLTTGCHTSCYNMHQV